MLTAQGCAARRARLWQSLPENVNWALVSDPRHLMYFANYFSDPFVFSSDADAAQLVLGRDGSSVLLTDNIGQAAAENAFTDSVLVALFYDGRHSAALRKALMARFALEQLETRSITGLGIEGGTAPAATILGLMRVLDTSSVFDMDSTIRQLRRAKDPDELDLIRKIMAIAEAGHGKALQQVQPGMTELEVYLLVTSACTDAAGRQVTIYGDFATGERALSGGGGPTERIIQRGDLCILDFSVSLFGYRCDFANSFVVGAQPTEAQRQLHRACLAALQAGEQVLRAGVAAADVYAVVHERFREDDQEAYFRHHAGHGIGLSHLELPFLVPESQDVLSVGDVVTIEPGLYKEGVGGMRIERNYLITEAGFEVLSQHNLSLGQIARS